MPLSLSITGYSICTDQAGEASANITYNNLVELKQQ